MSPHDAFLQGPHNRLLLALLVVWSCCLALLVGHDNRVHPRPAVVDRFLARADTAVHSVRMRRRLEARNDRYKKHGWVDALVSVDPVGGFRYEVTAEGGSGYILPVSLESTAHVVHAGRSTFVMTYEYDEVNGERVDAR